MSQTPTDFALTEQQIRFFDTFGYLRLPGLFSDDIERMTEGFEDVFADETHEPLEYESELHRDQKRVNMLHIVDRTPKLAWLHDDPRVLGVARDLMDCEIEFSGSDGSLFYCETTWHADTFGAPVTKRHVKLSWYLDDLTEENGAIRVIPGTNKYMDQFASEMRAQSRELDTYQERLGISDVEVPSWPIPSTPGDLLCWDYRTLHASFNGGERRRLFSYSFREVASAND